MSQTLALYLNNGGLMYRVFAGKDSGKLRQHNSYSQKIISWTLTYWHLIIIMPKSDEVIWLTFYTKPHRLIYEILLLWICMYVSCFHLELKIKGAIQN